LVYTPGEHFTQKKRRPTSGRLQIIFTDAIAKIAGSIPYLPSSETVSFFLPRALRAASTLRPFTVDILSLNPCLFFLFLTDGWKVLFMIGYF
jgi:hypothetical protein